LLLLVHQYYKTNEELGTHYAPKHIFMVKCSGDKNLESFLTEWFTMLARIPKSVDEDMLRDHFLDQMRMCECMKFSLDRYDSMMPGDPDKTYNTLTMMAQRQINLRRNNENEKAISAKFSSKAAPAHPTHDRPSDCKFWLKGGCTKGANCTFKHDPAKKGKSPKEQPSAKVAPAPSAKKGAKADDGKPPKGDKTPKGDPAAKDKRKPNPCYDFAKGKCSRGSNCTFEHRKLSSDEKERMKEWTARSLSRDKGKPEKPRDKGESLPACAAYLTGHCAKGHRCKYQHVDLPSRQTVVSAPSTIIRDQLRQGS
jgi:hypothetical protein